MTNEEAINMLHGIRTDNLNLDDAYTKDKYEALGMAIKALEQEPIQPKAKVGKWISIYGNVKCSICGNVKDGRSVGKATHYCDFCGAKMESEVEE